MRLNPTPEILGFIPNQYDARRSTHRQILAALPEQLEQMKIRAFSPIRDSAEFVNASGQGLPLHIYRPSHPAKDDFKEITSYLINLIGKPKTTKRTK